MPVGTEAQPIGANSPGCESLREKQNASWNGRHQSGSSSTSHSCTPTCTPTSWQIPFAIMGVGLGIAVLGRSGVRRPKLETWGALTVFYEEEWTTIYEYAPGNRGVPAVGGS